MTKTLSTLSRRKRWRGSAAIVAVAAVIAGASAGAAGSATDAADAAGAAPYAPTPASLNSHPLPQWFDDSKFGIFVHWGAYSVPAYAAGDSAHPGGYNYAEWYGNFMNDVGSGFYEHHKNTYGTDYDYDQFLEDWDPSKFDPDSWVDLFTDAGAKYVVLTSKHHDGIALWDSPTGRDTVDGGPGRDLVGELFDAVHEDGSLKAGFYYSLLEWYNTKSPGGGQRTNPYTGEALPYTGVDPALSYTDYMHAQVEDLISSYDPDILWCDGQWAGSAATWDMAPVIADYYNQAADRPTPKEVVVNNRCKIESGALDSPELDFQTPEYEVKGDIEKEKWESSRGIGMSYGYNQFETDAQYQTADELVDSLVDIVSKNGNLLLNVGPKADGTIADIQQQRLREMGAWLDTNGKAIYGTTYYSRAEEPESEVDVRYTQSDGALYATALQWPEDQLTLGKDLPFSAETTVRVLGSDDELPWSRDASGRIVVDTSGTTAPSDLANVFAIETPGVSALLSGTIVTDDAVRAGSQVDAVLRLENSSSQGTGPIDLSLAVPAGWEISPRTAALADVPARSSVDVPIRLPVPSGARTSDIRVTATGEGSQTFAVSVPVMQENLALEKPAKQSSTYTESGGATYGADKAVDGIVTGSSSMSNTLGSNGETPWWEVDLQGEFELSQINVFNRKDCCTDRLSDFTVAVSDEPFPERLLTADDLAAEGVWSTRHAAVAASAPASTALPIPEDVRGRYVRVQLNTNAHALNLVEVQAFGVADAAEPDLTASVRGEAPACLSTSGGGIVDVAGADPGSTVYLAIDPGDVLIGEMTAEDDGTAAVPVDLPDDVDAGTYDLVVTGVDASGVAGERRAPHTHGSATVPTGSPSPTDPPASPGPSTGPSTGPSSGPGAPGGGGANGQAPGLAATGADVSAGIALGLLALGAGVVLLVVRRVRRKSSAPAGGAVIPIDPTER